MSSLLCKTAVLLASVCAIGAFAAAALASTGSWTYTFPVNGDIATFTGSCSYDANNAPRTCDATQVSGPTVTDPFHNKSGNCETNIAPATPGKPATVRMACSPQ